MATQIAPEASRAKAGDRVLDIGSGNAYLALLFSTLVGPNGHVDIHNTPSWIAQSRRLSETVQRKWIKRPNVGWMMKSWNEVKAPDGTYDVVILGRIFHEILLEAGDLAGAAAEAGPGAAAGAWVASAPCFSPLRSMSPPFISTKMARAANIL